MKYHEKLLARKLRKQGDSIREIAKLLGVSRGSVSLWVRDVELMPEQQSKLSTKPFSRVAIEKRRVSRLKNEAAKRQLVIDKASNEILSISKRDLWLMGVALYWAEGGKTQRTVRFSNSDPSMIVLIMRFFREICNEPEGKFRGHIHIHPHLDHKQAEAYWSGISGIPLEQFFKTYRKQNISSQNKKDSLPHGVLDVYVMDTELFLKIKGWIVGIYDSSVKMLK